MLPIPRYIALVIASVFAWMPVASTAQSNVSDAQVDSMAKMYRDGRAAYESWAAKADAGDTESQFLLGAALYDQGLPGIARDRLKGIHYLELAAAKGNAEALAALGLAYEQGRGVPRDYVKAINYYVDAGKRGNARAQFLSIRLSTEMAPHPRVDQMGALEMKEDAEVAFRWYDAYADRNDPKILTNLGRAYSIGLGTERNPLLAIVYSAHAARLGSEPAKNNATKLLREFRPATLPVSSPMREAASTSAAVITQLPKGTKLYPLMRRDGWVLVLNPTTFAVGYIPEQLAPASKQPAPRGNADANNPWPARPAPVKGALRCNTNCKNGDCYRTYSDGRKVRFQAKQVWDSLNNTFTWDAGGC